MESIRTAIESVLEVEHPCTVRQVYYQLVTVGAIAKTEAAYDTVGRLLGEMRREGRVPYAWIADNTRWMRKPRTWASLEDALAETQATYRRALWADQDVYVEVWLEKDALAGVLYQITEQWDVPLMVTRGFASLSFLHSAAETIAEVGKPTILYYFGDHDPSGVVIDRKVEGTIRKMAPGVDFAVQRVAVLDWQIGEWGLPTRPTKTTDTRRKAFGPGESVEVDAIPPGKLRELCRDCILRHVDADRMQATIRAEEAERDTLAALVAGGLPALGI